MGGYERRVAWGVMLALVLASPQSVCAQLVLKRDEALRLAFPEPAVMTSRTAYLSDDELKQARELAGRDADLRQRVVTYYVGYLSGRPLGVAYFDAHRVRTLNEVLMIVVTPEHRIERIEVLHFAEPPEYRAAEGWLGQFGGTGLSDGLSLKAQIVPITGATLTSMAITRAARRVLALHRVIRPFDGGGS